MTFGERISEARKRANLSQKELANRIKKEDGNPISPQYLNDLERDRRNPPSEDMLEQFAQALEIPVDVLHFLAGELASSDRDYQADDKTVVEAFIAFRRTLRGAN